MSAPHAATHELKTWPAYFQALVDGVKNFEIRVNDRGFKVGDRLRLREYIPEDQRYSGREMTRTITYMTDFGQIGNYVALGLDLTAALTLSWTSERPTVPGWWWFRKNCEDAPHIVEVGLVTIDEGGAQQLETLHDDFDYAVKDLSGEWSTSPLPPPREERT